MDRAETAPADDEHIGTVGVEAKRMGWVAVQDSLDDFARYARRLTDSRIDELRQLPGSWGVLAGTVAQSLRKVRRKVRRRSGDDHDRLDVAA